MLATRSPGKLRELHALFRRAGVEVIDLRGAGIPESADEEGLENAETFEDNALSKARYFQRLVDLPVVADDSGLEVVALQGAPGVQSKRWSGRADLTGQALDDANNALLLTRLAQHDDRRARYVCAAAYCDKAGAFVERGETLGRIRLTPEGRNGFGYDPLFESAELGATFGEVSLEEKSRVSHRARAFAKLLQRLTSRQ